MRCHNADYLLITLEVLSLKTFFFNPSSKSESVLGHGKSTGEIEYLNEDMDFNIIWSGRGKSPEHNSIYVN